MTEFENLIDSSNITHKDWYKIAHTIKENYDMYDAFIVFHGTDTMAYTASALSFMIENLNKTIIITGSQIPLYEMKNDALSNVDGSLIVAGHFNIPEVCIFFDNNLMRGNRTTKSSSTEFLGFTSPNFPSLGVMNVAFNIRWDLILRHNYNGSIILHTDLCKDVCIFRCTPEMNLRVF